MLLLLREVNGETQSKAGSEIGDEEMRDVPEEEIVMDDSMKYEQDSVYDTGWNQSQDGSESGVKQVRFSANMPSTRQSRFGTDEENSISSVSSVDQSVLRKGSATSAGFRRRQVTRLMSLQDSSPREKERERHGSLPVIPNVDRQFEGGVVTVGDVIIRWVWLPVCSAIVVVGTSALGSPSVHVCACF